MSVARKPGLPPLLRPVPRMPGMYVTVPGRHPERYCFVDRAGEGHNWSSPLANMYDTEDVRPFRAWLWQALKADREGTAKAAQGFAVDELRTLLGEYLEFGRLVLGAYNGDKPGHADVVASAVCYLAEQEPGCWVPDGWAVWSRAGAEEGLPIVTHDGAGRIVRVSSSLSRARQTLRPGTTWHPRFMPPGYIYTDVPGLPMPFRARLAARGASEWLAVSPWYEWRAESPERAARQAWEAHWSVLLTSGLTLPARKPEWRFNPDFPVEACSHCGRPVVWVQGPRSPIKLSAMETIARDGVLCSVPHDERCPALRKPREEPSEKDGA